MRTVAVSRPQFAPPPPVCSTQPRVLRVCSAAAHGTLVPFFVREWLRGAWAVAHRVSRHRSCRPELVGKDGEEAKTAITTEGEGRITTVEILAGDAMMTMDYRTDRVRIFVSKDGKVERAPMVG